MSLTSLLSSLPLWMALAFGQVSYGFSQQTDERGTAFVVVSSDEAGTIEVEVRGDDGTVVKKTVRVKAGQEKRVTWTQKKTGTCITPRTLSPGITTRTSSLIVRDQCRRSRFV